MSARAALITFATVAMLGLAGLLVSATHARPSTAFSLNVPPSIAVATLGGHRSVCQGPIETAVSFGSVTAWVSPGPSTAPPGPAVDMFVNSASGRRLAAAHLAGGYTQMVPANFVLSSVVPAGRTVFVCLTATSKTAYLWGGPTAPVLAESHAGKLAPPGGVPDDPAMALTFKRSDHQSLLSMLPAAFRRASLFRFQFVGPWLYWLLLAAMLTTFAAGALAVVKAAESDDSAESSLE